MDRHDLRKLSDSALAEHVLAVEHAASAADQLALLQHDRDKLLKQLKHTADALRALYEASDNIRLTGMTGELIDTLLKARQNAAEVLAICATYVHK